MSHAAPPERAPIGRAVAIIVGVVMVLCAFGTSIAAMTHHRDGGTAPTFITPTVEPSPIGTPEESTWRRK